MALDELNRALFFKALQKESIPCGQAGCPGSVDIQDLSRAPDRVKTFGLRCDRCDWRGQVTGSEQQVPPWDDTSLLDMAYEHLMHQPAFCAFDRIPLVFTSLPNPRRRARYRVSCYYCGRQTDMDWPPPDLRR
jgi:hypothetical protein